MAHMTDAHYVPGFFRTSLVDLFTNLRNAVAKRREYNITLNELNNLSDRELADLGIARGSITRIAYETVYGA